MHFKSDFGQSPKPSDAVGWELRLEALKQNVWPVASETCAYGPTRAFHRPNAPDMFSRGMTNIDKPACPMYIGTKHHETNPVKLAALASWKALACKPGMQMHRIAL